MFLYVKTRYLSKKIIAVSNLILIFNFTGYKSRKRVEKRVIHF